MIVLHQKIISQIKNDSLLNTLFLTHIGDFPKEKFHYRERKGGIDEYILIHCVDGKGWYEVNGERFKVEPNIMFILPTGIPHRYSADSDEPWSIFWIHFTGSLAHEFMESFSHSDNGTHHFVSYLNER